jgi:hypothetical protein
MTFRDLHNLAAYHDDHAIEHDRVAAETHATEIIAAFRARAAWHRQTAAGLRELADSFAQLVTGDIAR